MFDCSMPGLNAQERQLILLIAQAQKNGQPLNMKQIVFSQHETATTVRRRVARLRRGGHIQREMNEHDGRSYLYYIPEVMMARLMALSHPLRSILEKMTIDESPDDNDKEAAANAVFEQQLG